MNGVWHHDSRYWRHRCEHGFEVEGTNASTRCQKTSKGCPLILCCATSPDLVVMLQHSTISLSAVLPEMDIPPTLPGGTQVDKLVHWSGLINSLPTLACLWPIHFLWYRIVHSGGQSHLLRLQAYMYLTQPQLWKHSGATPQWETVQLKILSDNYPTG